MKKKRLVVLILLIGIIVFCEIYRDGVKRVDYREDYIKSNVYQFDLDEIIYLNIRYKLPNAYSSYDYDVNKLLLETMVHSSTYKYSAAQIYSQKQNKLMQVTYSITDEYAGITIMCPKHSLKDGYEILKQLVFGNKLNAYNNNELKDQYLLQNKKREQKEKILRVIKSAYFHDESIKYGAVDEAIMNNLNIKFLKDYYKNTILKGEMELSILGNLTDVQVQNDLGDIEITAAEKGIPEMTNLMINQDVEYEMIDSEDQGIVYYSAVALEDEVDIARLYLLKEILAAEIAARLRSEQGLSYYNGVSLEIGKHGRIIIQISTDNAEFARAEVNDVLEHFETIFDGDGNNLFAKAKTSNLLALQNTGILNDFICACQIGNYSYEEQINYIESSEANEANEAAKLNALVKRIRENGGWFYLKNSEDKER